MQQKLAASIRCSKGFFWNLDRSIDGKVPDILHVHGELSYRVTYSCIVLLLALYMLYISQRACTVRNFCSSLE